MGLWSAGSNHNAVKFLLFDDSLHVVLSILGAGKEVLTYISHPGKGWSISRDSRNIYNTSNIDTAFADKDTDSCIFSSNVSLFNNLNAFCATVASLNQLDTGSTRCTACLCDWRWNIFWSLEHTRYKNTWSCCLKRIKSGSFCKTIFVKLNTNASSHGTILFWNHKTYRKHNYVKLFFIDTACFVNISEYKIATISGFINRVNSWFDKSYFLFISCTYVVFFVIFAKGSHIHIKNCTVKLMVRMLFCNHGIFYSIHTTYWGTVAITAFIVVSWPNTL